jgi:cytochrome c oxidase cbb3-type subunit 3
MAKRNGSARTEVIVAACLAALLLTACEREARRFREPAPAMTLPRATQNAELAAGENVTTPPSPPSANEENAYAVSQGKRLFSWYNCVGCHAHGGGGMGPPLMDDKWIYGPEPAKVFRTIVDGRPNGMPSFAGKIPEGQVWQLVAYVRSMSGLVPTDAAPGRDDNLAAGKAENRRERAQPRSGGAQPSP